MMKGRNETTTKNNRNLPLFDSLVLTCYFRLKTLKQRVKVYKKKQALLPSLLALTHKLIRSQSVLNAYFNLT